MEWNEIPAFEKIKELLEVLYSGMGWDNDGVLRYIFGYAKGQIIEDLLDELRIRKLGGVEGIKEMSSKPRLTTGE